MLSHLDRTGLRRRPWEAWAVAEKPLWNVAPKIPHPSPHTPLHLEQAPSLPHPPPALLTVPKRHLLIHTLSEKAVPKVPKKVQMQVAGVVLYNYLPLD